MVEIVVGAGAARIDAAIIEVGKTEPCASVGNILFNIGATEAEIRDYAETHYVRAFENPTEEGINGYAQSLLTQLEKAKHRLSPQA